MRRLVLAFSTAVVWINVLVCGAFPPRGQIHNPDVMHQIVHLGLFPDKPRNMTFLEYFQQFTDVNESLAKVLQRIEFNVLDIENMDNVIKLAEDVKRLKEIKMAALDAERATRDETTLDNPQNARRANKWYPGVGWGVSNDVFHLKKFPTAWTSETKQKLIQFMQHSVYSTRYEINKLRSLRKRYENSTVFIMGKIYGNQMQLGTTAALVFGTMMRMPINQITMLWYVYHYTKLMNLAQDVVSNTEQMYLLSQRIKDGYAHLYWYRGAYPPYTSMPTDSAEATSLNPDDLYKKKKKKK